MAGERPLEKLRVFLRDLNPQARALLRAELERAAARGDEVPGGAFILEELRRDAEAARPPEPKPTAAATSTAEPLAGADRLGSAARYFFAPLEPFLIDEKLDQWHRGRVARAALEPVWQWISRDLMPSEAKAYGDELARVLRTNDRVTSERLARTFQDLAAQRMRDALAAVQDNVKARQRLIGQLGLPRATDHLSEVIGILRARDALAVFASRLPPPIRNLADEQLANMRALLDSPVGCHRDVFVYALILVMNRLVTPWQLVRLAVKAADSDVATKILGTPYAVAVSIVICDIERVLDLLREDVQRGRFAAASEALKDIHDAVRFLRTELDLSGDSQWARQLTTIRSEVSHLVGHQLETVPGRMRRLLRPRRPTDMYGGIVLDASEVQETEALIEFASVCRNYASELAINEVTARVYTDLQNYLETGTAPLLDGLRSSEEAHLLFRQSQIDAAVRFAGKVFGPSYASLLAKAAEVAAQGPERKAAKG